jgi:hypothetical protein
MRTVPLVNGEDLITYERFKPGQEVVVVTSPNGKHTSYYTSNTFNRLYKNGWVGKLNASRFFDISSNNQVERVTFNNSNKIQQPMEMNKKLAKELQNLYNAENRARNNWNRAEKHKKNLNNAIKLQEYFNKYKNHTKIVEEARKRKEAKKRNETANLQRTMNEFRKILAGHAKNPKKNNLW